MKERTVKISAKWALRMLKALGDIENHDPNLYGYYSTIFYSKDGKSNWDKDRYDDKGRIYVISMYSSYDEYDYNIEWLSEKGFLEMFKDGFYAINYEIACYMLGVKG